MSGMRPIDRLIAGIPEPIAERALPWKRAAFRSAGVAPRTAGRVRLFIGPVNSAGQGYAWARAAERIDGVSAVDFMYRTADDVFDYPADHRVDTVYFRTNKRWQAAQRRAVTDRFTHVIIESGRQIFGATDPLLEQIDGLRRRGVQVALLWHGSDIRVPSRHAEREPDSPFRQDGYADTALLERSATANHALMPQLDVPVFVSTPDLLAEVPRATWLPVVVGVDSWTRQGAEAPLGTGRRPVVAHAPSNAGLKGSALVAPVLHRLHDEGLIDYREVRGVPSSRMPDVYGGADIVLDQFALGIYGVAACEAMAAGRVVISHVSDEVRATVRSRTGEELPIIQSRAAELERTLRGIVAAPETARAVAASGPAFVRRHHDGARSAEALRPFLALTSRGGEGNRPGGHGRLRG